MQLEELRLLLPVVLLASSCASTLEPPSGDLTVDLRHRDPRIRIEATRRAADETRHDLVPALLDGLEDGDPSVRFFSAIALRRLSSRDFGYVAHATLPERRAAVARWRTWAESQGREE